ncbi:MAG: T9SS type A sorting domain-containing protein [Chitinophagales bacterium]|nr:T9SS type A sorting domain-containing protein [Chitinophagales bacterium]
MKKITLPIMLITALFTVKSQAQTTNKAYAITSETKGTYNWTAIREIDLSNGNIIRTLYSNTNPTTVNYNFINSEGVANRSLQTSSPTVNGVAAAAYDAKTNRLYFTPMWGTDLRYVDLNTNEMSVVINNDARFSTGKRVDESNVITRMVIAANGNGYALTNDGNQLIQFTTDRNPVITNLGALIDSKNNQNISVHAQCTSWGGDLIGDAYGNLYLFTYRNHVFKINPATRIAEHIGVIKNLPANFTTNGAAVDTNGDVFITSAVVNENYYKVNLSTLNATEIIKADNEVVYNTSDLANSNLAYSAAKNVVVSNEVITKNNISVYPNPVVNKTFAIQFDKLTTGNYSVEISDVNGRRVITKTVAINGTQNEKINLPRASVSGLYFIKVLNSNGKSVYYDKVVVQ